MAEEDEDVVLAGIHQNDNTLKKSSWHELHAQAVPGKAAASRCNILVVHVHQKNNTKE